MGEQAANIERLRLIDNMRNSAYGATNQNSLDKLLSLRKKTAKKYFQSNDEELKEEIEKMIVKINDDIKILLSL